MQAEWNPGCPGEVYDLLSVRSRFESRGDPMPPLKPQTGTHGLGWAAVLGVGFVTIALIVLAIVPVYLERSHNQLQGRLDALGRIHSVEDGQAGRVTTLRDLASVYSRQSARVVQYVNSGDTLYRRLYRDLLTEETQLVARLTELSELLSLEFRQQWVETQTAVADWHLHHAAVMGVGSAPDGVSAGVPPESLSSFAPRLSEDRVRGAAVRQAVRDIEDRVVSEALQARARLELEESLQFWLTVGSGVLAVMGLLVMIALTRYFRTVATRAQQRRQEAVSASRQVRSVLEATGDGVFGLDLQGRCTSVNRTGALMLGYAPGDLKGRRIHDLVHHSRSDGSPLGASECIVTRAIETGEPIRSTDEVFWRANGTSLPVQLSASPMADGRSVIGVVLTFTDLTEVREAESALQDALRARDHVLAIVSHDLRNPVGTIGAAAELLLDVPVGEKQRRDHLKIIRRSAERMSRLIQDLLDVARIEAGQLEVVPASVDFAPLVLDAIREAAPIARGKGIEIEEPRVGSQPVVAQVDRYRTFQVLSNLLGNAIKFTPSGGRVTVSLETSDDWVSVAVADTGPGIDAKSRAYLFDLFWRGKESGRKGTGLGLAIVRGIVAAHGGRVTVDSEPGEGSVFTVHLPRGMPENEADRESRSPAASVPSAPS